MTLNELLKEFDKEDCQHTYYLDYMNRCKKCGTNFEFYNNKPREEIKSFIKKAYREVREESRRECLEEVIGEFRLWNTARDFDFEDILKDIRDNKKATIKDLFKQLSKEDK